MFSLLKNGLAALAIWSVGTIGAYAEETPDLSGVKLTLVTQSAYYVPAYAASGLFKDTPYELEFAVVTGTSAVVSTLLAGAADLGTLGDFSLILAQSNAEPAWPVDDVPLKNILALSPADPVNFPLIVTIAGKDSGVRTLADIRGKRFSYTPGGNANLQYLLTLKAAGLKPSDVQPVQLDFGVGATALANGHVDVITNNIASSAIAFDAGAFILAKGPDVGLPGVNTLTANSASLKDPRKKAAIRDFAERYLKQQLWEIQHPKELQEAYIKGAKQSPAQAELSQKSGRQIPTPIDAKLLGIENGVAGTVSEYGLVKRQIDVVNQYDPFLNDLVTDFLAESQYASIAAKSVAETAPKN